jgi:DNA-binding NtrC family response regulator
MLGSAHERDVKKRILFVDDDPAILAGFQCVFRKDCVRWEMRFALGGQRALDELRQEPFDVVVSDMRMPGLDGATLLQAVKDESPATIRIMLTGYAEDDALAYVRPVVDQLLEKPCSVVTLRDAIEHHLVAVRADGSTYNRIRSS